MDEHVLSAGSLEVEVGASLRVDDVAWSSGLAAVASSCLDGDFWGGAVDIVSTPGLARVHDRIDLDCGAAGVAWCGPEACAVACDDGDVVIISGGSASARLGDHEASVASCAWCDGALASGSSDATVKLWDLDAACATRTLRHRDAVCAVAWGATALFSCADRQIDAWDPREKRGVLRVVADDVVCSLCLCLCAGDHHLLVAGLEAGTVALYETRSTRQPLAVVAAHREGVHALAPAGTGLIATAADDCTVGLLETRAPFRVRGRLAPHTDYVRGLATTPSTTTTLEESAILSGGWDGRLVLQEFLLSVE